MFENVGASVVYYNDGASIGLLIFFAFFWIIFAAAGYVLTSFFLMRIFPVHVSLNTRILVSFHISVLSVHAPAFFEDAWMVVSVLVIASYSARVTVTITFS